MINRIIQGKTSMEILSDKDKTLIKPEYADTITTIVTVKDLMESEFKGADSFFLPFRHSVDEDGFNHFSMHAEDTVIVNSNLYLDIKGKRVTLRDAIQNKNGCKIPTRDDIQKNRYKEYNIPPNTKLIGAGSFIWIRQANHEDRIYLQRRTDKKATITTVSGLVSEDVIRDAWRETVEESGICLVNHKTKSIGVITPKIVLNNKKHFTAREYFALMKEKYEQLDIIHTQLPSEISEYEMQLITDIPIEYREGCDTIYIHKLDGSYETLKGFAYNAEKNNFNVMLELTMDIPAHFEILTTDPENMGRPTALIDKSDFLDDTNTSIEQIFGEPATGCDLFSSFVQAYQYTIIQRELTPHMLYQYNNSLRT